MAEPFLRVEGVSKSFPGVTALHQVDFDLHAGEVHVLIGENGAGKSTLIKLLSGVYPKDEGRFLLDGQDVSIGVRPRRPGAGRGHDLPGDEPHPRADRGPEHPAGARAPAGRRAVGGRRGGPPPQCEAPRLPGPAPRPRTPRSRPSRCPSSRWSRWRRRSPWQPASSSSTSPPVRWPRRKPRRCSRRSACSSSRAWASSTSRIAWKRSGRSATGSPSCGTVT